MSDWQTVIDLHTKLAAYVKKHNLKPLLMLKPGNSVPDTLGNRIFSFNAGGGIGSHGNELAIIGIEETIGKETLMVCHFYVIKDRESQHAVDYPVINGRRAPEFTVDELAALLTGLELFIDTVDNPGLEPANEPTHTPPRTLH